MAKHVSGIAYVLTFVGLLALATLSLLLSFLHWSTGDLVVSLVIAAAKALLVLMFFMHLVEQRAANRLTVVVSLGFAALLIGLVAADVATRQVEPARVQPPRTDKFYVR
jgi:cytochrome c oxidase subunit 4